MSDEQCAETLVSDPNDLAEIKEISFYRKYNRMKDGPLDVGDKAPYVQKPLVRLDGSDFRFFEDFLQRLSPGKDKTNEKIHFPKPCVVIAASHS